ncbi:MAG: anti-sigma factor family protein [Rubripirellula sp.]
MHEDLLGYLLGALEPHEMRRVAQRLQDDPEARQQLAEIERSLRPLEGSFEPPEDPPRDLVSRTLANLPPLPSPETGAVDNSETGPSDPLLSPVVSEADDAVAPLKPLHSGVETARSGGAAWIDWIGAAGAVVVILSLMLPALAHGRFEARKVACQDQLRQFGTAITQFVNHNPQDRLPAVSEQGPEAFAGVFAVRLNEAGLLTDPSVRWCPSLDQPAGNQAALTNLDQIVSLDELHDASVDRLRQMQQFSGGHYAYNLGVVEQDRLTSPKFESRASFAVMSDAPLAGITDPKDLSKRLGHNATGINVLYEDGRVRFVALEDLEVMPDHPLLNHRGEAEAGVNVDDASLAPSWRPPFLNVRQR